MPEKVPLNKLRDFLSTVPPFHLLSEAALEEIVRTLVIEYFPKAQIILSPGAPPTDFLYIIRSGGVRLLTTEKEGESSEKIFDYRDEGEFFGLISLLSGEPSPFTVVAEEDTLCYLIKKDIFKKILLDHPGITLYFTTGPSKGFKAAHAELIPLEAPQRAGFEVGQILFTSRVRDVMRSPVLTCSMDQRVVDAARMMTNINVGSMIVVDDLHQPIGIMTDTDLRVKLLAPGNLQNVAVKEVMSQPVKSVSPEAFCYEAFLSMITNRVKHLAVLDGRKLVGIISGHDLMLAQGNDPVAITKEIQQAMDVTQLVVARGRIEQAMKIIFKHGGSAKEMCELVTTLNDQLTQKIILLAEEEMVGEGWGPPPVPYAWIALGSEGRREQTLATDQDNAIVFSDVPSKEVIEIQSYFLKLAEKVVSGLERCGFPRCKGGIMSVNPKYCQPYLVWEDYFVHWMLRADDSPQEVMIHSVFFDLRSIYGPQEFEKKIIDSISFCLDQRGPFLRELAENAIYNRPPLGFFKKLVVEKTGEHQNMLDLKKRGLTPLVESVRIFALERRIFETNTLDRISALSDQEVLPREEAEDLKEAFNVLMLMRVRHHVMEMNEGREPGNYVNPDELSLIQRAMLKEAFKAIDQLQGHLETHFGLRKVI
jgi:CBS domain-containing protein